MRSETDQALLDIAAKNREKRDIKFFAEQIFISKFANPAYEPALQTDKSLAKQAERSIVAAKIFYKEWKDEANR